MRALITGAAGLLGSHLLVELVEHYDEIIAVDLNTQGGEMDHFSNIMRFSDNKVKKDAIENKISVLEEKIRPIKVDISEYNLLLPWFEDIDHVYHTAAKVSSFPKQLDQGYIQTNIEGTKNILKLCKETDIQRLIYTSSFVALGPLTHQQSENEDLADETHDFELPFIHPYISTKYQSGQIVDRYASTSDYDIISVNPTTIMGYGMKNMVSQAIVDYLNNRLPGLPNGGHFRANYALAQDVAKGHVLAAKYGKHGEKYLLGGDNYYFDDFLCKFGELVGRSPPRSLHTWILAPLVWLRERFQQTPLLTYEDFRVTLYEWAYDDSKARRELKYQPQPITTKSTIIPLLNYFLETGQIRKKFVPHFREIIIQQLR